MRQAIFRLLAGIVLVVWLIGIAYLGYLEENWYLPDRVLVIKYWWWYFGGAVLVATLTAIAEYKGE